MDTLAWATIGTMIEGDLVMDTSGWVNWITIGTMIAATAISAGAWFQLFRNYKSTNKINEATIARYTTEQAVKLERELKGVNDKIRMLNKITDKAIKEKNLHNVPEELVFRKELKGELQKIHLAVIEILENGSFKDLYSYQEHFVNVINTNNDISYWVKATYNPLMNEIENAEGLLKTGALDQDLFFARLRQPLPLLLDETKDKMLNPLYKNLLGRANKKNSGDLVWLGIHKRFKDRFDKYRQPHSSRRYSFFTIRLSRD